MSTSMPAAHLHSVVLRSAATATSHHVVKAAQETAKQLRQDASAASLDPEDAPSPSPSTSSSSSDSSFGDCSSPASSVASPAATSSRDCLPIAGLDIDHEDYPAHPELGSAVRLITARQYAKLAHQVTNDLETPEHALFPWLHGADQANTDQAAYFGYQRGARCPTPRFRGLVTVTADVERPPAFPPHHRLASLGSTSFVSSASASSLASSATDSSAESASSSASSVVLGSDPLPSQLCSTLQPDDLLDRTCHRFVRPLLPAGVNLRNFRIQAPKYATISDIVVYCERGASDPAAVQLAHRFALAQQTCLDERRARGESQVIEYRVLLVTEPFTAFERHAPHLVAVDSMGNWRNRVDFLDREREEMRALTEASEIAPNVFLGNTQDVPQAGVDGRIRNPLGFSVCVEAHDQALMSQADALRAYDSHLARLRVHIDPRDNLAKPAREHDVVHLECISTGQACPSPLALAAYIDNIVNLVLFLRRHANPASMKPKQTRTRGASTGTSTPPATPSRRVLVHCQDGYTDSSVLALAYVMQERACTLPEAYLHLQLTAGRSFFVYPSDRDVLERVEARFARLAREAMSVEPEAATAPASPLSVRRFFSTTRVVPPALPPMAAVAAPRTPLSMLERAQAYPWFYAEHFDGHFPSRILPFLYLGNLNHAKNALMLKELGITHVVSIGETALIPPANPLPSSSILGEPSKTRMPINSLWYAQRTGQVEVLDLRGVSDDGIDSIRPSIDLANEFIEGAREAGGKVLVHCRVGVSRSSTLVIAYLMQHLEMDLASAYLLCRSRRLNILIQPTLLFMNALQWHEARLNVERRAKGEPIVLGQLSWASLSQEVFQLNSRYLSC